ncbi:hypothetical protein BG004_005538 [Podila humilis]|nr:hypothetical protein BG004_005538 [Podila humilis]
MPRTARDAARTSISFAKRKTAETAVARFAKIVAPTGHGCLSSDTSMSKMDFTGLSKLNIKTLRGYLLSYNISTQGMIEKQDLVRAIQSLKPIPESSEAYFRAHLPESAEKSTSLFEEIANFGRSATPADSRSRSGPGSESDQGSSNSSDSSDGWSWDLDKFFSRLFGSDDSSGQAQSSPPSQPQQQPQLQPHQQQYQPRPQPRPQSQPQPSRPAGDYPGTSYRPQAAQPQTGYGYCPPPGHPLMNTQARSSPHHQPSSTQSSPRPTRPYAPARTQTGTPQTPRPGQFSPSSASSPRPRAASAQATNGHANSDARRTTTTTHSTTTTSTVTSTMSLEQVMVSRADPSTLSIKVIKSILDSSFVTYVGVVEKQDLVDRLQKLIDNTRAEQAMVQEQEAAEAKKSQSSSSAAKSSSAGKNEDDNLCKICCDAALNCVMLNCNHMSTCMDW